MCFLFSSNVEFVSSSDDEAYNDPMPQKVTPPLVQSTILRDVGGIVEKIEVPGGASPYEQALVDSPVPIQVRYPS